MVVLLHLLLLAQVEAQPRGAILVESDTACPRGPEVVARLTALLGPGQPGVAADRARLVADGETLVVTLRRADGSLLAERRLPARGPCSERAAAVAVVLAAWRGVALLPPEEATVVDSARRSTAIRPGPSGTPWAWEVGAGVAGGLAGDALAPGAVLLLTLTPGGRGWGGGLALTAEGERARTLGPGAGQARWARAGLALGPHHRLRGSLWALDLRAAGQLGLFRVRGEGFDRPRSGRALDGGLSVGARLVRARGMVRPWLALDLWRYFPPRVVFEAAGDPDQPGRSASVPSWTVLLCVGVSVAGPAPP